MKATRIAALLGACSLLAGAVELAAQDQRIPITKDRPAVSTTTSNGDVTLEPVAPAVLPAFSVASYPALTEKNITAIMAAGDSLEIQLGDLARTKGTAQSVRDFGAMLATDHRAHLTKTHEIITDEDVGAEPVPNDVEGARLRGMLNWLQTTPASAAWDAAFLRFQAQHHQNAIDLFSANLKNAHDDDLEAHITATLQSLAKHRDTAKSAATALGVTM
jgi:putative membrane protein